MGLVTKEIMDSPITSITNRPVGAATHDTFIIVHYVREDMEAARTGSLGKMFHMDWQSLLLWQPELPYHAAEELHGDAGDPQYWAIPRVDEQGPDPEYKP